MDGDSVPQYINKVIASLEQVSPDEIGQIAKAIWDAHCYNTPILVCGNGGSAATAMHFAGDLRSLGVQAWDLLSPVKVTQLGNDFGYKTTFSGQGQQKALVIAFSCSGTSPNIVEVDPEVFFTSSWSKAPCSWLKSRLTIMVESDDKDYETVEDVHLVLCHAIKNELKAILP
jgi:D-sedoheptulose 7-phosphate isomerase